MRKKVKAVIAAAIAMLFCGGASACGEFFEGLTDVKVTVTEWNKAFAFDYTHYQINASFIPESGEQEKQNVELNKDGDIMCLRLSGAGEDEDYDYSVYAARVGNDYKKYDRDETGAWRATKQTKENYNEFHASTIMNKLFKEIPYSSFTYNETETAYSYTQALPSGENAATYTVGFLDNRIVEMNIEIDAAPITFTFMGMDIELEAGTLACTFAYKDKDLILPSVTSPKDTDSEVTAEEWCDALTLYDAENVQVLVTENDVNLGRIVKDGDIVYMFQVNGDFGDNEELYMQINEEGEILKEYRKDQEGTWVLYDYQNSDHNAPGSGLGLFFNFVGGNADTYSFFTYDEEEGLYSFTKNGPLFVIVEPESSSESSADTESESEVTTTVSFRFLNKKLVEMVIKTGTATETVEIVCQYTYYVQNLTLPTIPEDNGDENKITQAEWEEALDLTAFDNFRLDTTSSDGLPVVIKKDGDVVYIRVASEDGAQEVYYEKDGDVYKQFYQDLETDAWMVTECSADEYESLVPINLNKSFSYKDFTYDEQFDGYSRTIKISESETQTTILRFWDKKLESIEDEKGNVLAHLDYEGIELILPTVGGDTEVDSK